MIDSPTGKNMGVTLDSAPPRPSDAMSPVTPDDSGMGDLARSPQIMTMQGMAMVKDGFQLLSNGIPAIAQLLSSSLTELEQIVTQSLSQSLAGGPQGMTPPGVAPMMQPPPGPGGPMGPAPMGPGGPPMGGPPMPGKM